jgi:predicted signal transduction protein with EAL and GGDEF domain
VLNEPFGIDGHQVVAGASVGIALAPEDGDDPDRLLKAADLALYRAKAEGRGTFRAFEPEMDRHAQARRAMELDLRRALVMGEFEVHYQPLLDLRTDRVSGFEALLRWNHPERGRVPPAEFVPVAEEIGLIEPLGEWVLQQACRDVAGWPRRLKLAVNVSPVQFTRRNLVEQVEKALARSGLPATQLDLEITESLFLQEHNEVLATMDALRARGIGFALDDFGTGYSSLSYVRRFPITKIKIDRSFVSGIPHDPEAVAIIQAVIAIATNLGLRTNAEGLEQSEQTSLLRLLGCDEGQGYGLGRPEPAPAILRLLAAQPNRVA